MTIHWKAVEYYFIVVLFVFNFSPGCILENLSILDLPMYIDPTFLYFLVYRLNFGMRIKGQFEGLICRLMPKCITH